MSVKSLSNFFIAAFIVGVFLGISFPWSSVLLNDSRSRCSKDFSPFLNLTAAPFDSDLASKVAETAFPWNKSARPVLIKSSKVILLISFIFKSALVVNFSFMYLNIAFIHSLKLDLWPAFTIVSPFVANNSTKASSLASLLSPYFSIAFVSSGVPSTSFKPLARSLSPLFLLSFDLKKSNQIWPNSCIGVAKDCASGFK